MKGNISKQISVKVTLFPSVESAICSLPVEDQRLFFYFTFSQSAAGCISVSNQEVGHISVWTIILDGIRGSTVRDDVESKGVVGVNFWNVGK